MDGQSEHTNQWLEQYLRFWVNEWQDNWVPLLPLAEFAHNNWIHEGTRKSPFFLVTISLVTSTQDALTHAPRAEGRLQVKEEELAPCKGNWAYCKSLPSPDCGDSLLSEPGEHEELV